MLVIYPKMEVVDCVLSRLFATTPHTYIRKRTFKLRKRTKYLRRPRKITGVHVSKLVKCSFLISAHSSLKGLEAPIPSPQLFDDKMRAMGDSIFPFDAIAEISDWYILATSVAPRALLGASAQVRGFLLSLLSWGV